MNNSILGDLSEKQLNDTMQNNDLRKKLRVDRIKKMVANESAGNTKTSVVEDPR
jgi:hypothetical protein